jgi:hypothetical protein
MDHIYQKFEVFEEANKVKATLQMFRSNFKRIESGLAEAWKAIQDEEHAPVITSIQERLATANEVLRSVSTSGAHYVRRDKSQPSAYQNCQNCNNLYVFKESKQCPQCGFNNKQRY